MRTLEAVLRLVARLLMVLAFGTGFTTMLSLASFLAAPRWPPLDNVVGIGITVMVSKVALWCWWTANTLAHLQRRAVAVGGIDRNPRRSF